MKEKDGTDLCISKAIH